MTDSRMSGPDHFREARRLMAEVPADALPTAEDLPALLAALVHTEMAHVLVAALSVDLPYSDIAEWRKLGGPSG